MAFGFIFICPDVIHLQDPQALSPQISSLTNMVSNCAHRSYETYVPAFKSGEIIPIFWLTALLDINYELSWYGRDSHPWELFAYGNCVNSTILSNFIKDNLALALILSSLLLVLLDIILLSSLEHFQEGIIIKAILVKNG